MKQVKEEALLEAMEVKQIIVIIK